MIREDPESLDTNGDDLENVNGGNITIANEQRYFKGLDAPIMWLCNEGDEIDEEGSTTVFDECCEVLEKIGRRNDLKNVRFRIFRRDFAQRQ